MNKKLQNRLFKRSMWTLLAIFFALILIIVIVAASIAAKFPTFVDDFFGATRYKLIARETDDDEDTQYYKSQFAVKDDDGNVVYKKVNGVDREVLDEKAMRAKSMDVAERVDEEGSVLLWNNNNALPLNEGDKVSTLGMGTIQWVYHGNGSGKVEMADLSAEKIKTRMKTALESRGFEVNDAMLDMLGKGERLGYSIALGPSNEMPWTDYGTASKNSIEQYGDAAIFTVSRFFGEGTDMNMNTTHSDDGNALSFTREELSVLKGLQDLKKGNKLKKVIVLINSSSPLSLKNVKQYDVDAALWVGWGGAPSFDAVADLLVGKANPSGRATDTWVYDLMSAPANRNFGNFKFANITQALPKNEAVGSEVNDRYVVYQEGIYVGYRYFETRYEDLIIGGRNADSAAGVVAGKGENNGKWNYSAEVVAPFGYGESYTQFEYSNYSVKKDGTNYVVSMTVKNVGKRPGKEVMQVYVQKPYTDYDIENKIEKAAVELVGFEKTELLDPDGSQTLTVTVPEYEFKSYDAYGKGTYIIEKGDYYLAAGTSSHNALNNILAAKGYTVGDGMDEAGNAKLAHKINYANNDYTTYSTSKLTGNKIVNQFDNADINRYAGTADQPITYLSRNNWKDTFSGGFTLSCTSEIMANDIRYDRTVTADPKAKMPKYGKVTSEYGKLTLIQLKDLKYDDPLWDDLLNQLTFKEQVEFAQLTCGAGATSVAAPGIRQMDGPCGLRAAGMAFPCNPIIASTFNKPLAEELGVAMGNEMLKVNIAGIYGTGANIHRSAMGGRSWEYYSEDGFLSGAMNSAESKGLVSMGACLYTKHFALNDQETNRSGVTTWCNEQAIREIYLKAFEAGITDGYTNGLMTSYNRIGATWSGLHNGLLTNVLRGEWDYKGVTVTDAVGVSPYMGNNDSVHAAAIIAGQDGWMGGMSENALDVYRNNPTVCQALREAAHRVLYVQLNSFAMNGMSSSTRVVKVMTNWEKAILAVEIVAGILAGACLGMTAASWVLWYKDRPKKQDGQSDREQQENQTR